MKAPDKSQKYETEEFVNELFWYADPMELIKGLKDLYIAVCAIALSHDHITDETGVSPRELKEKLNYILAIVDALEFVEHKAVAE